MATKSTKNKDLKATSVNIVTVDSLKAELANTQMAAQQAVAVANLLAEAQAKIDNRILNTTFKGEIKNSWFWVIRNWREVIDLVIFIRDTVKAIRERFQAMAAATNPMMTTANA